MHRSIFCVLAYLWNALIDETNKMYYYAYTHGGTPFDEMEDIKMKKIFALLLAATMILSLAACGGKDSGTQSNESATPAETTTPADTAAPADAAAEFTTVTAGKLTMCTNAAFPPYESTDDSGNFVGIDVEIAQAIADKLGLELQIDDMDFDAALLAAQNSKSDIVMAGVTVNEERLAVMNFSESYSTGVQSVIVKEGSDVTLDNLGDYMIGTQRGTTGNIYCSDDYGDDHVIAYDNGITAVQALVNGQVDAVVIDNAPAQSLVAANSGLTILDTEYAVEDYAIGMAKSNTALLDAVNGALAELQADGTVQSIVDKYIGN